MSSKYKVYEDQIPHFVTCTVVNWIDALSRPLYKETILQSIQYCTMEKGMMLHAWIIMNNHVHLIISASDGNKISNMIRDFKKFTSRKIIEEIDTNPQESRKAWMLNAFAYAGSNNSSNERFQFWQQDYHPVELHNRALQEQRLNYLHENPVRAGIVWEAQQYKYSSAIDYYEDKKGLLDIIKLIR